MAQSRRAIQEARPAIWPRRAARRLPNLPQFYYHTNFCEMLRFAASKNAHCLSAKHNKFLAEFFALPLPAQCLYVRMAGRKGYVCDSAKFIYNEIEHLPDQIEILRKHGFICSVDASSYKAFLGALPKPDLLGLISSRISSSHYRKSWTKPLLIDVALRYIPFEAQAIAPRYIVQARQDPLAFLMFLYFGKIEDNL